MLSGHRSGGTAAANTGRGPRAAGLRPQPPEALEES